MKAKNISPTFGFQIGQLTCIYIVANGCTKECWKSLENSEGLTDGHLHGILRPVFKWAYKIAPDWPINPVYDYTYTMNWMSDLRLFCHVYICIYSVANEFTDLLVIDEYWYIYFTWNRLALFNPWSVIHFYLLVNSIRGKFTSNENKGTD